MELRLVNGLAGVDTIMLGSSEAVDEVVYRAGPRSTDSVGERGAGGGGGGGGRGGNFVESRSSSSLSSWSSRSLPSSSSSCRTGVERSVPASSLGDMCTDEVRLEWYLASNAMSSSSIIQTQ